MNRDDIIHMAREAGVFEVSYPHPAGNMVEVERFAALVAAAALEAYQKTEAACVKADGVTQGIAAEIRARGQE